MANPNGELKIAHVERTEAEMIQALGDFSNASFAAVGVNQTFKTVTFLTKMISESPDLYRKIFHPKTLEKLEEIGERNLQGNSISSFEMMAIVADLMKVFK